MSKLNLTDPATFSSSMLATIAANNAAVETAVENTLSRDGSSPNTMEASLDMNSNRIYNLPDATLDQEPVTLGQLQDEVTAIFQDSVDDAIDASPVIDQIQEDIDTLQDAMVDGGLSILQTGTGAVATTIVSLYQDRIFTPEMFGAEGDGTTDDTVALQNWFAAIKSAAQTYGSAYGTGNGRTYRIDGPTSGTTAPLTMQTWGEDNKVHIADINFNLGGTWSVSGTRQNMMWFAGTGRTGSQIDITSNVTRGDLSIDTGDTSSLAVGDLIVINARVTTGANYQRTQIAKITSLTSNSVTLDTPVKYDIDYTTDDTYIQKVSLQNGLILENINVDGTNASGTPYSSIRLDNLMDYKVSNIKGKNIYGGLIGGTLGLRPRWYSIQGVNCCGGGGATGDPTSGTFFWVSQTDPYFEDMRAYYTGVTATGQTGPGWEAIGFYGATGRGIWVEGASTRGTQQWLWYGCDVGGYHMHNNATTGFDIDIFSMDCTFRDIEALNNGNEGIWGTGSGNERITIDGVNAYGNGNGHFGGGGGKYDIGWTDGGCTLLNVNAGTYEINEETYVQFVNPPTEYPGTVPQSAPLGVWNNGGTLTVGPRGETQLVIGKSIYPAQITGDQNDYAPTGIDTANVLVLDLDTDHVLTGIVPHPSDYEQAHGRQLKIINKSAYTITFNDVDAASAAENRFALGSNFVLDSMLAINFWYDANVPGWRFGDWAGTSGVGSGAPDNASYITLGTNAVLTSERVLTAGAGITGTDAGAGSTYTIALDTTSDRNTDHAGVTLTAGAGLTGGGDITSSRSFAVGAGTGITVNADDVALDTANTRNSDHSAISVIAGDGLTGGGDITTDRTLNVVAGTGISVNANDVALDTSHVRNVDHTGVTLTAGAGLTGGGDISANRSFAVGAGTGITVNADDVALTTPVAVANGGTGLASYTTGQLVYASAATTLAGLSDVATGSALISGGVGTAPSYGKIGLTTHVSGVLPVANGGTGLGNVGYVHANKNGTDQTGTSGLQLLTFGNEVSDAQNQWDTTASTFTAAAAGLYQFVVNYTATSVSAADAPFLHVVLNGTHPDAPISGAGTVLYKGPQKGMASTNYSYFGDSALYLRRLSASDVIRFYITTPNSGTTISGNNMFTQLFIYRISD